MRLYGTLLKLGIFSVELTKKFENNEDCNILIMGCLSTVIFMLSRIFLLTVRGWWLLIDCEEVM
jgi:hypothetical protein